MLRTVALFMLALLPGFLSPGSVLGGKESGRPPTPPEVGYVEPTATAGQDNVFPGLTALEPRLDVSALYTRFTGDGMRDQYGGMTSVAVGLDFHFNRVVYGFMSLGYGDGRGNSLDGVTGFSGPDDLKLRAVPFQLGMKLDSARSERVRFFLGAALEFTWMQERMPSLNSAGHVVDQTSAELNSGWVLMFGPEFALGDGRRALGLELGWGGAKGRVKSDDHSHPVDLTGLRGRLYYTLALWGKLP
jgi:hypothetical protein